MGRMIYETKTTLILRRDLAAWQLANVAAFLAGGLAGTHGYLMGEPYRDGAGRAYSALIREPVLVYGATLDELRRTHQRALSRELVPAIYIERMFETPMMPTTAPPWRLLPPMRWTWSASGSMACARPWTRW